MTTNELCRFLVPEYKAPVLKQMLTRQGLKHKSQPAQEGKILFEVTVLHSVPHTQKLVRQLHAKITKQKPHSQKNKYTPHQGKKESARRAKS